MTSQDNRTAQAAELRAQAEEKLGKQKQMSPSVTKADTQRLVHELQVHQIELEMQNEELVQSREELEAVLRKYTDLYDFAPVGYITLARDGAIHQANLAAAKLLGVERDELIQRRLGLFVSRPFRLAFSDFLEKVFASQENENCEIFLQKDSWIHMQAISADGQECRATLTDITERKRAEREILQLNANLEQRVEERTHELRDAQEQLTRKETLAVLGQLAGGVGHELRNPLGVINSAIYYLKMVQPDANENVKQYHDMIETEVHNAEKIINDLLNFARGVVADREQVSIPELVQSVLDRFPAPPSVEVALKLPADLPKVFTDPRQMEQVLGNLVVNAYQALPNGGKLQISARQRNELVVIAVNDAGTGITPENMQKIFEPLFTTKAKGIGLGLAVSKKLAEANNGRIEVESEPGKGSTFTVTLPIQNK
jgi:PAS domain S-box-containing protein